MADVKRIKVTGKTVMTTDDKRVEIVNPEILVIKKETNEKK